jgi:hypothetical protein
MEEMEELHTYPIHRRRRLYFENFEAMDFSE